MVGVGEHLRVGGGLGWCMGVVFLSLLLGVGVGLIFLPLHLLNRCYHWPHTLV